MKQYVERILHSTMLIPCFSYRVKNYSLYEHQHIPINQLCGNIFEETRKQNAFITFDIPNVNKKL